MVVSSKKGFFLTIISILSITLIFLSLQVANIQKDYTIDSSVSVRSSSLDIYMQDLEDVYLPNILLVATRQSLSGMNAFIQTNNAHFDEDDIQSAFYQLISNGTLQPNSSSVFVNESVRSLIAELENTTQNEFNIDINITYFPYFYKIYQTDAWFVGARMLFVVNLSDPATSWTNKTLLIDIQTPILGLEDPYYLINTGGAYSPRIQNTSIITGSWNISVLKDHILAESYDSTLDGIAYLDRFTNSSNASSFGIEGLVNPVSLGLVGEYNTSYVDRYFWTTWNCSIALNELYEIDDISADPQTTGFRLDPSTLVKYLSATEYINNKTLVCP